MKDLITQSSLPLKSVESDFAVDSTGFTTARFVPWYDHKYGVTRQEHDWVKVHLMCGVKTDVVTAVEIHERDASDTKILPSLVAKTAVGHRVVHGGPKYWEPQHITLAMVEELHQLSPFDPEHLPEEILLTEAFHRRFPDLPQIGCFDTAFHHEMPRVL